MINTAHVTNIQSNNQKYFDLAGGLAALSGASLILIFFMTYTKDSSKPRSIILLLEGEKAMWAGLIYTISSALYYFIRSGGKAISGGYSNPIFQRALDILRFVPTIGLILTMIKGSGFILQNPMWISFVRTTSDFLNSIFILFIVAQLGSGITAIQQFVKTASK